MGSKRILIVDDDRIALNVMKQALEKENFEVICFDNGKDAIEELTKGDVDVLITDIRMPDLTGMDLLQKALEHNPELPVIMITGYGSIEGAVEAMKAGAFDYMTKPVDLEGLRIRIERALDHVKMKREIRVLRGELAHRYSFENIIGKSRSMQEIFKTIIEIAPSRANVMIVGESGTGKELVARAIHFNSPRRNNNFVPINCAAIPEGLLESELFGHEKGAFTGAYERRIGKFEIANGGTIFLDEVGDIPLSLQVKLLRVLEQREFMRVGGSKSINVDVRVISATNRPLEQMVADGKFREDLYYRLKVITIEIPPLRNRKEDIPLLVDHFVKEFSAENQKDIKGIEKDVLEVFMDYHWPGNVRELRNTIETMVVLARKKYLTVDDIPNYIKGKLTKRKTIEIEIGMPLSGVEKELILKTLDYVNGNRKEAARLLKIGLRTLQRKIKIYSKNVPN